MTRVTVSDCITAAARYFDVPRERLTGKSRAAVYSRPRMFAMLVARNLSRQSFPAIGRTFRRDHTTILHGAKRARALAKDFPALSVAVDQIEALAMSYAQRRRPAEIPDEDGPVPQAWRGRVSLWTPDSDAELLRLWRASVPWAEIGCRLGVCVCMARNRIRTLRRAGAGPLPDDVPAFVPLIRHQYL